MAVRTLVIGARGGVGRHVVRLVHPEPSTAPVHERDIAAVAIEELSEDRAREVFGGSSSPETVDAVLWFVREALAPGQSPATDTASLVLGRPPLPFSTWANDNASAFR